MGRVRLALVVAALGCALVVFPFGSFAGLRAQTTGAGASSTSGQSAAGVSFTLQKPTACVAPAVVLGRSCVDKSRMVVADKWVVGDGSAQRNTDLYQTAFSWIVPQTIPPAGSSMTLKLTATGLQGNRICPALSVRGGFGSSDLLKCAESDQSVSPSLSAKLVPPSATAGATALLVVSVLDGPVYTYKYRAGAAATKPKKSPSAATGKCRKLSGRGRTLNSSVKSPECVYTVSYRFDVVGRGVTILRGSGSARGTNPKRLKSIEISSALEPDDNQIVVSAGDLRLVLDVVGASYSTTGTAGTPGARQVLSLQVVVFRTSETSCPKGARGTVTLHKYSGTDPSENRRKVLFDIPACGDYGIFTPTLDPNPPHNVLPADVSINITHDVEIP
jgi:hypothetical protein